MAQTVEGFFAELESKVEPEKVAGMTALFQFNIEGDGGGQWSVQLADGKATDRKGESDSPSITRTATAENWLKIRDGKMGGQTAFLTGKLKIKGDMSLALKMQQLFPTG